MRFQLKTERKEVPYGRKRKQTTKKVLSWPRNQIYFKCIWKMLGYDSIFQIQQKNNENNLLRSQWCTQSLRPWFAFVAFFFYLYLLLRSHESVISLKCNALRKHAEKKYEATTTTKNNLKWTKRKHIKRRKKVWWSKW